MAVLVHLRVIVAKHKGATSGHTTKKLLPAGLNCTDSHHLFEVAAVLVQQVEQTHFSE